MEIFDLTSLRAPLDAARTEGVEEEGEQLIGGELEAGWVDSGP